MTDYRDPYIKRQEEHDAHLLWLSWPIIPAVLREGWHEWRHGNGEHPGWT